MERDHADDWLDHMSELAESLFGGGWAADGLPVIPPTRRLVDSMLDAAGAGPRSAGCRDPASGRPGDAVDHCSQRRDGRELEQAGTRRPLRPDRGRVRSGRDRLRRMRVLHVVQCARHSSRSPRGVPTVVVCTYPFLELAKGQAVVLGGMEVSVALIGHPLASLDRDGALSRAHAACPASGRAVGAAQVSGPTT